MRKIAVLVLVLMVTACAYKHQPVYNVDNPMPRWMQDVSSSKVEDLIVAAGAPRDWKFTHVADGHLVATQTHEKYSATVDIFFDRAHWRIVYQDSAGLLYTGSEIHSHYNSWIHLLEHDIEQKFGAMAVSR
jgi:hypothetical protein